MNSDGLFKPLRVSFTLTRVIGIALILTIGVLDWRSADEVPLGFLYLLPMLLLGRVLRPSLTLLVAGMCTCLTEKFDPFAWNLRTGLPRDCLYFIAFASIGLFVHHSFRTRRIVAEHMQEIERQSAARLDAERQLIALIETSPAAIVTTDLEGTILAANHAAHELLGIEEGNLPGLQLPQFFPSMRSVLIRSQSHRSMRTVVQARGAKSGGEGLVSEVCFSTYDTAAGPRFTALLLDSSDELRSREEASLRQILVSSRLAVSAMSHEIRNVCGAIGAVHRNIQRRNPGPEDADSEALGNLVIALERLATVDLQPSEPRLACVDLATVFEDLKIVIAPEVEECGIAATWRLPADLSNVWAEPNSLMQVFLNLLINSMRALSEQKEARELTIAARNEARTVKVFVIDSGGGIERPERLFRPFQNDAQQTGLGLFLSRAFMRSFGGDLQFQPVPSGSCFVLSFERAG